MQIQIFFQNIIAELKLLLKAPIMEPSMVWIILPLIATFLIMTFYFGIYKKEELGWNTAVANMIVLLFIVIDLTKHLYYYSPTPSTQNFLLHPAKTLIIIFIFLESVIFGLSAFGHALPKKILFFATSPLSLNIQAYVIISIVYLRKEPTVYTFLAAIMLFLILFVLSKVMQKSQRIIIERKQKSKLEKAKQLHHQSKKLMKESQKTKGKISQKLKESSKSKKEEAKNLENEVMAAELIQTGELDTIKRIIKKRTGQKEKNNKKKRSKNKNN